MGRIRARLRNRIGAVLVRWGAALQAGQRPANGSEAEATAGSDSGAAATEKRPPACSGEQEPVDPPAPAAAPLAQRPGVRLPLSVERAVKNRDLSVLRREAADALAALGSAHALVTSARLAQLQGVVAALEQGNSSEETLNALTVEYQAWQSDQVRLFDALRLVLAIEVPRGRTLDQIDPRFHDAALNHLGALSIEYQRLLLAEQFRPEPPTD